MQPLSAADLMPFVEYERAREAFRQRIITLKRDRRIGVGDTLTLIFENRDTIQFQIQEMIRVERILDPAKVQEELDVYNDLLPGEGELSATLLIELTDQARIKEQLDQFQGIDQGPSLALVCGPARVYGTFEAGHSNEEKISAVHFVRFRPEAEFLTGLARPEVPASIHVHHRDYEASTAVPESMRQQWLADLGLQANPTRAHG